MTARQTIIRVPKKKSTVRPLTRVAGLELKEKIISIRRVVKVTKGGRRFRFSALVVVGNGNGIVGIGKGKAREVPMAVEKAINNARKNLYRVPILHGTVPHEIVAKFKAAKVLIRPAAPGTGIIAGNTVRAVLEVAGYENVIAKSLGSNNPRNLAKATLKALLMLEDPLSVARRRGIPLNKVFHG